MTEIERTALAAKRMAWSGFWDGKRPDEYFNRCRHFMVTHGVGIMTIFTRDVGYHSSGWWKNPDYERCFHLSVSFMDYETLDPMPKNNALTEKVLKAFYLRDVNRLWCEPPYGDQGKRQDVWHYRLFCDKGWNPIKPRGEVYSKELTEANWLSWSDYQALLKAEQGGGVAIPEPNRNEVSSAQVDVQPPRV